MEKKTSVGAMAAKCLLYRKLEVKIWRFTAVLLLRNKDQEYNNPLTRSQPAFAGKGSDMSELRSCTKRFGVLAVTTLPWWA